MTDRGCRLGRYHLSTELLWDGAGRSIGLGIKNHGPNALQVEALMQGISWGSYTTS